MLPTMALVDPSLACSLPAPLTASTGLDALTQLIEAFVSRRANPLTDACCRQGIPRALRSLEKAVHAPEDPSARTDMALASLYSGMALANAGLGAVHAIAGPLGGMHPSAPHGALCAVLLPHSLERLHAAVRNLQPTPTCLFQLEALAEMILGDPKASITEALSWLHAWVASFALPSLRHYGLSQQEWPLLAEKSPGFQQHEGPSGGHDPAGSVRPGAACLLRGTARQKGSSGGAIRHRRARKGWVRLLPCTARIYRHTIT